MSRKDQVKILRDALGKILDQAYCTAACLNDTSWTLALVQAGDAMELTEDAK